MAEIEKMGRPPRELLHDAGVIAHCEGIARPIAARARAIAGEHVESGDYVRSIHIERHRGPTRTTMRVIADDPKASILEARYHVIGRSIG